MFGFSPMNSLTICFMNGPSPPVKPFQYDSVSGGPSYVPLNVAAGLAAPPPPAASLALLPPPQPAISAPAAAPTPRPMKRRREISRALPVVKDMPISLLALDLSAGRGGTSRTRLWSRQWQAIAGRAR